MAAPIYSQEEADALIKMRKRIDPEAWKDRTKARPFPFVTSDEVSARPETDDEGRIAFKIEIGVNEQSDSIAILLKGRIDRRPMEGLCRYDIQDGLHENPPWFPPPIINPGQVHRHDYSERSVQEFDRWDKCALPLDLSGEGSPEQLRSRLWRRFLDDLGIRFCDTETIFDISEALKKPSQ